MARDEAEGSGTGLVDLPPTARQTRSAVVVAAVALVALAALAPIANTPLRQLNLLFPLLDAIVCIIDSITAVLLYSQFTISRSRAVFALAAGYLFTALIVIPHALTISGAFSPTGLLGANNQTGSWLFIFWHLGFALSLLVYAVLRVEKPAAPGTTASPLPTIFWSLASLIGLVCGLTWLATAGATLLPQIVVDATRISPIVVYPISLTILITAAAFVALAIGKRTLLDQWLMVVAVIYIAELTFSGLLPSVRFSVGFYAGRAFSLVTSSIVLIILIAETTQLYVRVARTNAMLQRERSSKLMSLEAMAASIAHEISQPLGAITLNCSTALHSLNTTPLDLEEVRACLTATIDDSGRANEIVAGIRGLFKTTARRTTAIELNRLVREVLRMVEHDLHVHGVTVSIEFQEDLPQIMADPIQLQQVILNLIKNAIEAMANGPTIIKTIRLVTAQDGDSVVSLSVQDSGPGIDPENETHIFDAFFTTKSSGMGLGLPFSQKIIEEHGGDLRLIKTSSNGCTFEITLPPVATTDSGVAGVQSLRS